MGVLVGMELPVGISFVSLTCLSGNFCTQECDFLLESTLFQQQLGVDLNGGGYTSDRLGICEARILRPFSAGEDCLSGLLPAEGGRVWVFMGEKP